ncbi:MAG: hypothetical protein JJE49_07555 [Peptostreptococcaceae bacterium]|nr:hypothetical protein [Peptostreptococcaceae bacterium]
MNLGYKDTLQKIVLHISQKYGISSSEPKKKLIEFLEGTKDPELIAMRKILYNYVPYRLISPFYDVELRRISNTKPGLKNLTIMELSARAWWRTLDVERQLLTGMRGICMDI